MGGQSTQTQTQNSTTAPWAAATPALTSILSGLSGISSSPNSAQTGAINTLTQNAGSASQFAPQVTGLASNLLAGGGATNQAGAVNQAYQQYYNATNPLASNTNYNPMSTPGFSDALAAANSDITNQVNSEFAAAGRSGSGMNTQTLARGLSQGDAQMIAQQYNANVAAQQGAAGNLYNAGNTNAGILSGLQQQGLTNQLQGVQTATDANTATNASANATLAAQAQLTGIPLQTLQLMASIGVPIAGLGSTSSGTSNTVGNMSGAQQFGTIASGIGSILSGLNPGKK